MKRSPRPSKSWKGSTSFSGPSDDAKKAIRLILRKTEISKTPDYAGLKDIAVTQVLESRTSAVENLISYEIEFILTDERYMDMEMVLIKELQSMFEKP